jgi:hypothetical protein
VPELAITSNHGARALTIRTDVPDHWIAGEWRGWPNEKCWEALEGDVWLKDTHNGLGTVALRAGLRAEPSASGDPDWSASLVLTLDAGGLDSLALRARQLA